MSNMPAKQTLAQFSQYKQHALLSALLISQLALSPAVFAQSQGKQALDFYQQAQQQQEQGQLENALILYSKASHLAPQDALTQLHLGDVLRSLGRHSEAMVHYQQAHKLSPTDPSILLQIGLTLEQLHEPQLAKNALLSLRQKQPQYTYVLYHLARLEQQQKHNSQAIEYYKEFLMAYPNHFDATRALARLYVVNRQPEQAITLFEHLQRQSPDKFSDHLTLAKAHNLNKHPQKALNVLKTLLNDSQQAADADVKAEIGFAHLALGQSGFAQTYFENALKQDPANPNIRLGLSRTYLNLNRPKDAIPHLNHYLHQYPHDLPVKQNLADAYIKAEDYPKALSTLNQLIAVLQQQAMTPSTKKTYQGQYTHSLQQKGFTLHQLGKLDEAIAIYTQLLTDFNSTLPLTQRNQIQQNLALAHHEAGHLNQAIEAYQTAYANTPNPSPQLQDDMARAWLAKATDAITQKRFTEAQTAIAQARSVASEDFTDDQVVEAQLQVRQYHVLRLTQPGNINALRTQYQQADTTLNQALAQNLNNTELQLALAELYLQAPSPTQAQTIPQETSQETVQEQNETASIQPTNNTEEATLTPPPSTIAKHTLDAILAKDPQNIKALTLLSQWHVQQQQPQLASQTLLQQWERFNISSASSKSDKNKKAQLAYELGNIHRQLNQPEKAIEWYQTATSLQPSLTDAHYNLGVVFGQQQKHTAARAAYQKALNSNPNFSDAIYGLATSHDFLGDKRKAIDTYQHYLNTGQALYAQTAQQRIEALTPQANPTPHLIEPTQSNPSAKVSTSVSDSPASQLIKSVQPGKTTFHVGGKNPVDIHLNVNQVTFTTQNPTSQHQQGQIEKAKQTPKMEEATATPAVEEMNQNKSIPVMPSLNTMQLRALPLDMLYQASPTQSK